MSFVDLGLYLRCMIQSENWGSHEGIFPFFPYFAVLVEQTWWCPTYRRLGLRVPS